MGIILLSICTLTRQKQETEELLPVPYKKLVPYLKLYKASPTLLYNLCPNITAPSINK